MIGFRTEIISETNNSAIIESSFNRYEENFDEIVRHTKGSLVAMADGVVSAYAMRDLERLGSMFCAPGDVVYNGQLVGECTDEYDYDINVCKEKKLSNVRVAGKEEAIRLTPPRYFSIEDAISYIRDEELVEVTPKSIRIRKIELNCDQRRKQKRNVKKAKF
jgi:GTP-binding protein